MTPGFRAAVVVVSYGSAALVEQNLALLSQDWADLDVIVVDCFSDSTERDRLRALCDRKGWTPVLLDVNAGFGGGVNRGADVAFERGADVLLVLNPDAVLDAVNARMLAEAAVDDLTALVAPLILRPDGSLWTEGVDLYLDDGTMAGVRHRESRRGRPRMFWVSGACFALSRTLWQQLAGFEESYFLYWEDVDLSRRVHDAGGAVRVIADAVATHDEGGTHVDRSAGRAKSETYYYYNIRNRLLFAALRLPPDIRRQWRRSALRVSWGIVLQGGRRQLLTSRAPWRALARGLRDARRQIVGPHR